MTFEAGRFEAGEAFRRRRARRSVNRGNALEGDAIQLLAHMRKAFGVAIEVDQVDLHCASAQRFYSGSFSVECALIIRRERSAQTFICAPSSTTRSDGKLKK